MWVSLPGDMVYTIIEELESGIALYGENQDLQEIVDRLKESLELCSMEDEERVQFRSVASLLMEQDDVVRIEENTPVSVGDEGADIMMWVHVSNKEVKELLADALEEQAVN